MDFYENRKDRFRPLGEWAFELFRKIRNEKGIVLYSKATLKELGRYYNPAQIKEIMQIVSNKGALLLVQINPEELREASALSKGLSIPFDDCLHAILARDNDAVMVTRDRHFEMLRNIAEIKKPEELI
jgi:predicted nucleic acid-binding protein